MATEIKVGYYISFFDRVGAIVYSKEIVGRIVRGESPGFANGNVASIVETISGWEGDWDADTRQFTKMGEKEVNVIEASQW